MNLRTAGLLLFCAAVWILLLLFVVPKACATTGPRPSIQILTSTLTALRLHSELEFELWEGLIKRDGEAKITDRELLKCRKGRRSVQQKLEIRTVTVSAALQVPDCPDPEPAEAPAGSSVRPLLASGLIGMGLGVGAVGLALPEQDQRRASLIIGGVAAGLGVLLLTAEMLARVLQ